MAPGRTNITNTQSLRQLIWLQSSFNMHVRSLVHLQVYNKTSTNVINKYVYNI